MRTALAFGCLISASVALPASACSVVTSGEYKSPAQLRKEVRQSLEEAAIIVDGEVIRPWTSTSPALVRVEHVLKGYPPDIIEVGGPSAGMDCTDTLDQIGERRRMVLYGGPGIYNLPYRDGSERIQDQILHSDRRKVWPDYRGNESSN